jgi:hypothetical protein
MGEERDVKKNLLLRTCHGTKEAVRGNEWSETTGCPPERSLR